MTRKVRRVAQNQFNCPTLVGAQLENRPFGLSCFGDHWDERAYYSELLSGVVSSNGNSMSALTLALFEDSGWYKANYSVAELSPWGHGMGCEFVENDCIDKSGKVAQFGKSFFCTEENAHGCNPSHTHKSDCSIFYYDEGHSIPSKFQYFSNPSKGGLSHIDYCPVYNGLYENYDCTDPNSEVNSAYWEEYGSDSRCFQTAEDTRSSSRCYQTACVKNEHKVKLHVKGRWYTCDYDFQVIQVNTYRDLHVTCPRLSAICPDMYCPANCSGAGKCIFATGQGRFPTTSKCECDNPGMTNPGCSETVIVKKTWLDDSSMLVNTAVSSKSSDPLVMLFESGPEDWAFWSWVWFAILLAMATIFSVIVFRKCCKWCNKRTSRWNLLKLCPYTVEIVRKKPTEQSKLPPRRSSKTSAEQSNLPPRRASTRELETRSDSSDSLSQLPNNIPPAQAGPSILQTPRQSISQMPPLSLSSSHFPPLHMIPPPNTYHCPLRPGRHSIHDMRHHPPAHLISPPRHPSPPRSNRVRWYDQSSDEYDHQDAPSNPLTNARPNGHLNGPSNVHPNTLSNGHSNDHINTYPNPHSNAHPNAHSNAHSNVLLKLHSNTLPTQ